MDTKLIERAARSLDDKDLFARALKKNAELFREIDDRIAELEHRVSR